MSQLNRDARHPVSFTLNGREVSGHAEPRMLLSDFLIHEGITSTHVGCEHGVCGACTVRIDDLELAVPFADGESIHTENSYKYSLSEIEALAAAAGFIVDGQWFDADRHFSVNLWQPERS